MELSLLEKLKMPFERIKFRPKTCYNGQLLLLAYLDSRDVMRRLDDCFGLKWECNYKEIKGNLFAGITATIDDIQYTKWDCGTESNTDAEKGESSDAFKRAAVKWGIGRYLYSLPKFKVPLNQSGDIYCNIKDNKTKEYISGYYDIPSIPEWATPEGYIKILEKKNKEEK